MYYSHSALHAQLRIDKQSSVCYNDTKRRDAKMEKEKVLIQAGPSIQRILFGVIAGIFLGGLGGLE